MFDIFNCKRKSSREIEIFFDIDFNRIENTDLIYPSDLFFILFYLTIKFNFFVNKYGFFDWKRKKDGSFVYNQEI